MDKETLLRLAQPAATFALALSVATLPMTVKAYGDSVMVSGEVTVIGSSYKSMPAVKIECVKGC